MKQSEIKILGEYRTRINGELCSIRVTAKRTHTDFFGKSRTVFDWVRIDPPAGARKIRGYDTAAAIR